MCFYLCIIKNLGYAIRSVTVAAKFFKYHTNNFGFTFFNLKTVDFITLSVLITRTYKLISERHRTAGINPVQGELVHTGFNAH